MIEDDLRAAFTRHEPLTPPTGPLRVAIDRTRHAVRRRRRRRRPRSRWPCSALLRSSGCRPVRPGLGRARGPAHLSADNARRRARRGDERAAARRGPRRGPAAAAGRLGAAGARPGRPQPAYLLSLPARPGGADPRPGTGQAERGLLLRRRRQRRPDLGAGYDLTRQAVAELTGVRVDAGAVLTYPGAAEGHRRGRRGGGLPAERGVLGAHPPDFPAGCQRLDGAAAVDLLRQRYGLARRRPGPGPQRPDASPPPCSAGSTSRGVLHDPVRLATAGRRDRPGPHRRTRPAARCWTWLAARARQLKSRRAGGRQPAGRARRRARLASCPDPEPPRSSSPRCGRTGSARGSRRTPTRSPACADPRHRREPARPGRRADRRSPRRLSGSRPRRR